MCSNTQVQDHIGLAECILKSIVAEVDNCFTQRYGGGGVKKGGFVGPININDCPSLDSESAVKNAAGGQLLALLFDYMRVSEEHVTRLQNSEFPTYLIKRLLNGVPNSELSDNTYPQADLKIFNDYADKINEFCGLEEKLSECMAESVNLFIYTGFVRNRPFESANSAVVFAPPPTSAAFFAIEEDLFKLSLEAIVQYSSANLLLKCFLKFLSKPPYIDSLVAEVDLHKFSNTILNEYVNQGSVVTVAEILKVSATFHSLFFCRSHMQLSNPSFLFSPISLYRRLFLIPSPVRKLC